MDQQNEAEFARARNDGKDQTELRVDISKRIMGVIDARWQARGKGCSRQSVVNEILSEWAEREIHAASLTLNLSGCNPTHVDSLGVPRFGGAQQ